MDNVNVKEEIWETDIKALKCCGIAPEFVNVFIKPLAKLKIDALMREYKTQEWLGYLVGEKTGEIIVNDIIIPPQVASAVTVENIDVPDVKLIGVIHSHHSMSNEFSPTDDDWINQNHDVSLCVNYVDIKGIVRWNTPCNNRVIVPALVKLKFDVDFDEKEFIEKAKSNIQTRTFKRKQFEHKHFPTSKFPSRVRFLDEHGVEAKKDSNVWETDIDDEDEDEKIIGMAGFTKYECDHCGGTFWVDKVEIPLTLNGYDEDEDETISCPYCHKSTTQPQSIDSEIWERKNNLEDEITEDEKKEIWICNSCKESFVVSEGKSVLLYPEVPRCPFCNSFDTEFVEKFNENTDISNLGSLGLDNKE